MAKKAKKPSTLARVLGGVWWTFVLALALGVGSVTGWLSQTPAAMAMLKAFVKPPDPKKVFDGDHLTILLLGCDVDLSYGGKKVLNQKARSDVMLVARFDFATDQITGVSIPRDTLCQLPGFRRNTRINAYHYLAKDGEEQSLTKRAVEHLLPGVEIDRVVTLDYPSFQRMVDLVGGVELNVKTRMVYRDRAGGLDINFKPGKQTLSGKKAMEFVRFRHDRLGDIARQERQKQFLAAFKDAVIRNPAVFPQVLQESRNLLGKAMSEDEIAALAMFVKGLPKDGIVLGQIPVVAVNRSYLRVDEDKLVEVLRQYRLRDAKTPPKPQTL